MADAMACSSQVVSELPPGLGTIAMHVNALLRRVTCCYHVFAAAELFVWHGMMMLSSCRNEATLHPKVDDRGASIGVFFRLVTTRSFINTFSLILPPDSYAPG